MAPPKVSILIPVYRGECFIARTIESALGQSHRNIELIIINDGSPDDSATIIRPYLSDRRVKYIEQANAGVAAARNTGIHAASGDLIALLDQDDLWLPDKLERQIFFLHNNPTVGMVHTDYAYIDNLDSVINNKTPDSWPAAPESLSFRGVFTRNPVAALTAVIRRRCLDVVGLFNEELHGTDDYELWLRISAKFRIGYIPEVLALYRLHEANVSRDKLKMELLELAAIQSVIAKIPDIKKIIGGSIIRARLFELNFNIARFYEWLHQDSKSAQKYYLNAIKYKPGHFPSYGRYLWNFLTPIQKNAIQWYLNKMRIT